MVPGRSEYAHWSMVVDADRRLYFKPDGVQLLSPTPKTSPTAANHTPPHPQAHSPSVDSG